MGGGGVRADEGGGGVGSRGWGVESATQRFTNKQEDKAKLRNSVKLALQVL